MDQDQISSDEFDFTTSNDESSTSEGLAETNESTGEDSEKVSGVKRRRISEESESESENNSGWVLCSSFEEVPPIVPFTPGRKPIGIVSTQPIDFFKLFFTNELMEEIISETNTYAKNKLEGKKLSSNSIWRTWRDVNVAEFWAFIAVIINMGTMPLDSLQEYWSKNTVSNIPFYSETFTRGRFSQIFWMLHLKKESTHNTTTPLTVGCYLDYVNSKFLDYFTPGEHICMVESTIDRKGRISFVTYNPKPTKWGVRVYTLTDSKTGYVCCVLPSTHLVRPNLTLSTIPIHLYKMLLEKTPDAQGHHMYTDRYYTSNVLAEELAKLKCSITGMTKGKELPEGIQKPKNSTVAYRRGNTLLLGWKGKKVTCLTTRGDTGMSSVKRGMEGAMKKPNIILSYMKHMGGVDRTDQLASTYCFLQKSLKWWRKLFFWGMEICLINSYILYKLETTKKGGKPLKHLRFVKTLVEELRGSYRQHREKASTSHTDEVRLNGKLHIVLKGPKRDCKVCSDRNKPGGRREVTYYCDTCPDKPRMHLGGCFTKYHTKTKYRV